MSDDLVRTLHQATSIHPESQEIETLTPTQCAPAGGQSSGGKGPGVQLRPCLRPLHLPGCRVCASLRAGAECAGRLPGRCMGPASGPYCPALLGSRLLIERDVAGATPCVHRHGCQCSGCHGQVPLLGSRGVQPLSPVCLLAGLLVQLWPDRRRQNLHHGGQQSSGAPRHHPTHSCQGKACPSWGCLHQKSRWCRTLAWTACEGASA